MSCSRTQHGDACGDRTQDLSIRSPTLYHYAAALPEIDDLGVAITKPNFELNHIFHAFAEPSEQVIEQDDRNTDGKIKRKVSKKKAIAVGAKVGKTALKVADHVADSGIVEQLGCLEGCINAIPCGPFLCCFCKFACICWKGRKQIKDQYPCAGMGPGEDAVDEIADAVDKEEPDTTDIVTSIAKDTAEKVAEQAEDAKSTKSGKSSGSTYSLPEWCATGIEFCHKMFPSKGED